MLTKSRALALVISVAALATAGCAQNAILELQVQLPANPPGESWFAQIQVRDQSGHEFNIPWMGGDLTSVPLTNAPQWDCLSVQSVDPGVSLNVRVRFCRSEDCLDLDDGDPPERLYSLETPFYIGARTYFRITVPEIPACDMAGSGTCASTPGVCVDGRCSCSVDAECGEATDMRCEPGFGCVRMIDRCSIEGCIEGPVSASYCSLDTGQHFCEKNPEILRDESFMCSIAD